MEGCAPGTSLEDRVARALEAGIDLVLAGNQLSFEPDRPRRLVGAVEAALRDRRVDEARLRAAAARVARLAARD